ncbi:MAG: 3-dehydroquinate synthase, partial [Rhodospirillales bacterium]|nr:3-dehydroquinate synthase [Rhodospirillales bacterium]
MSIVETLHLDLGNRGYDILVGSDLLSRTGELAHPLLAQERMVVITDENVAPIYLDRVCASIEKAGIRCDRIILPAGEQTKSFKYLEDLLDQLLELKVERRTTLAALGGGVIGDLVGLAAAIILRGIDFIQIPTTLLSQVDSSVGGKTAIDTVHGKNLVGAFHQPRLVIADVDTLDSLPANEMRAGYAEVVKYGLINDAEFFSWLESNGAALCEGDKEARRRAVLKSCAAKSAIVSRDEREDGV